jgi:hypothetical protein
MATPIGTSVTFSNPRLSATVTDWPSGRHRTTAMFEVEKHAARGERLVRTTLHPKTGRPGNPKKLTYARRVRLVDGSDGRTYILERTSSYIQLRNSNLYSYGDPVFPEDPGYAELAALLGLSEEEIRRVVARRALELEVLDQMAGRYRARAAANQA